MNFERSYSHMPGEVCTLYLVDCYCPEVTARTFQFQEINALYVIFPKELIYLHISLQISLENNQIFELNGTSRRTNLEIVA